MLHIIIQAIKRILSKKCRYRKNLKNIKKMYQRARHRENPENRIKQKLIQN